MIMKELHKLAKDINYNDNCFYHSPYVVKAIYDRKTKSRYMGIWRNGGNLTVYFCCDGLNSVEITDLLHDKLLDLNRVNKWR